MTVGSELVRGDIVNGNGRWLARQLEDLGVRVNVVAAVADDVESIAALVESVRDSHDIVIVSGGLGATPDDVTREGIARAFDVGRETDGTLARALERAGGYMADFADEWARLPAGSRVLRGLAGGAPAFAVENVYVLAGDPKEMRSAFRAIREDLHSGPPPSTWRRTYATTEDRIRALLEQLALRFPAMAVGSYASYRASGPEVEIVLRGREERDVKAAAELVETTLAEMQRDHATEWSTNKDTD